MYPYLVYHDFGALLGPSGQKGPKKGPQGLGFQSLIGVDGFGSGELAAVTREPNDDEVLLWDFCGLDTMFCGILRTLYHVYNVPSNFLSALCL